MTTCRQNPRGAAQFRTEGCPVRPARAQCIMRGASGSQDMPAATATSSQPHYQLCGLLIRSIINNALGIPLLWRRRGVINRGTDRQSTGFPRQKMAQCAKQAVPSIRLQTYVERLVQHEKRSRVSAAGPWWLRLCRAEGCGMHFSAAKSPRQEDATLQGPGEVDPELFRLRRPATSAPA